MISSTFIRVHRGFHFFKTRQNIFVINNNNNEANNNNNNKKKKKKNNILNFYHNISKASNICEGLCYFIILPCFTMIYYSAFS